jgi:hypothetical protein
MYANDMKRKMRAKVKGFDAPGMSFVGLGRNKAQV